MKVLAVGNSGQVAQALRERSVEADVNCVALGRKKLDLLQQPSIEAAIDREKPDLIINAAAYTAVDLAESEEAVAFALNAKAPGVLAKLAAERDIPLIHISTDYVFDGSLNRPYVEQDQISPIGVYGVSKAQGEGAVRENSEKHLILRTAWVYSPFGSNFVKTMLKLGADRECVRVVSDQIGNPTNALDLADAILNIGQKIVEDPDASCFGTYHLAGTGSASWADVAERVFKVIRDCDGKEVRVERIPSSEYQTPAKRPKNSQLNCSKLASEFGVRMPLWTGSLERVVQRLIKERS